MVLPHIFNKAILGRVNIFFSDGYSQEVKQIYNDIIIFIPNVYTGRCGWHIVDRGWQKRVAGIT